ncbi:hypothetical protein [Modestobacter marinus]|uniref:hypothetical protein n=1 Tax=Modestobacter marinus TaxID=477641 RepID=UPI001C93D057|nr:hypothetical protein [Modestobacter marinus]
MTSSTSNESAAQSTATKNRRDSGQDRTQNGDGTQAAPAPADLDDLARAQENLTQEVRQQVARQLVENGSDGGEEARVAKMLAAARSELLEQLLGQQQEQARRQLAEAARQGEDVVAGVVRSVTSIVRSIVPAALVRPEDLIEATYSLADQGLRVGRRLDE